MSSTVMIVVIVGVVVVVLAIVMVFSRRNSMKRIGLKLFGTSVDAEGFDRPGAAKVTESESRSGAIRVGNSAGGDAEVSRSKAKGDIEANVGNQSRPKA